VKHLYALAELYLDCGDVAAARDEYLASLDADEGLAVLLVEDRTVIAAAHDRRQPKPRCRRCGARLSVKRHRCSRCGLASRTG
jgi:ribosomal protein L40E